MEKKEKRRHTRFQIDRPCRLSISGEPPSHAQLIDLSEGGLAVVYSESVAVGAIVELAFDVNVQSRVIEIGIRGCVRHTHQEGESHVIGMEFLGLSPETANAVRELIDFIKVMRFL